MDKLFDSKPLAPFKSIIIFGPPGSGKGTLGKALGAGGNHFHLSSGDIFRGLAPDSPAGKLYHTYAHKGHLLPDAITIDIWHHYVLGLIDTNRYYPEKQLLLLDGIPRTVAQAIELEKHISVSRIINLQVPNVEVLIKRLQRRAVIEKRVDDMDESVLKKRMEVYERETLKLLNHYPADLISTFDGSKKPLDVLKDVLVELSGVLSL